VKFKENLKDKRLYINPHFYKMSFHTFAHSEFMHTWSKGLKTGQYYLRSQPKAKALQFTVAVEEDCVMCSA